MLNMDRAGKYNPTASTANGGNTYDAETNSIITYTPGLGGATPTTQSVYFGNLNGAGTITLASAGNWAALGYAVGQGIYIAADTTTDPNGDGAAFTGSNYYTIAAVNGSVITLAVGQTLTAETGSGGNGVTLGFARVNATTAVNSTTQATVTLDTYNPSVYDPNFTYLLTATQVSTWKSSIVIPTQAELLSGISAGLLEATTSTQVNIEAPNITATNIIISAPRGNIGTITNPVTGGVERARLHARHGHHRWFAAAACACFG